MTELLRNRVLILSAALLVVGAAGCAASINRAGPGNPGDAVVFGKLEIIRNDERVRIGDGALGNAPVVHVVREADDKRLTGRIGRDGEFAWHLAPGSYRVSKISFFNQGNRVETGFRFRFTIDPDSELVYVGTLRLVTRFFAGYYGVDGVVGYSVRDDCARDCGGRLEELGMTGSKPLIALLRN